MSSSLDSLARAASIAARAASSSAIGTTMPGNTMLSVTNSTGMDLASDINPPKVKSDALNLPRGWFVPREREQTQNRLESAAFGRFCVCSATSVRRRDGGQPAQLRHMPGRQFLQASHPQQPHGPEHPGRQELDRAVHPGLAA